MVELWCLDDQCAARTAEFDIRFFGEVGVR